MSADPPVRERLSTLRREFHRYPEPAWREFYTTCRLVEEIERIGVDVLSGAVLDVADDDPLDGADSVGTGAPGRST